MFCPDNGSLPPVSPACSVSAELQPVIPAGAGPDLSSPEPLVCRTNSMWGLGQVVVDVDTFSGSVWPNCPSVNLPGSSPVPQPAVQPSSTRPVGTSSAEP